MQKLGKKQLTVTLKTPLAAIPPDLARHNLERADDGQRLVYTFDTKGDETGIAGVLRDLAGAGIDFTDLQTRQSSLEDIFVSLVSAKS